ncbi:glucokinase [Thermodesulfatator autotrophicus]|uniref:Glucokinase n=1 Tax=Thermodesulfatator autotrophicus TaxID=1795632 RepID=A0A177E7J6_9BACT|nr:glucokinase [Thermodesulfatator autotrophicus]OAG27917.1 hypothetical protein TH606_04605 [Thermodesulfatator autotrophicus]
MILAGDIGGTKTLLAIYELTGPARPKKMRLFSTKSFSSIKTLLNTYISEIKIRPTCISLGVAGPVIKGQVNMVNVGWRFTVKDLKRKFNLSRVFLLNDLEALAYSLPFLSKKHFIPIKSGRVDKKGNLAIIAAGTGLGEALLIRKEGSNFPVATEGGHADFAPWNELTYRLHAHLSQKFGHVSWERVASGPGIENIYEFLCKEEGLSPGLSSAKEIGQAGLTGKDPLAEKALELFFYAYGAEAGNLALKSLATGGVFIGGGIAPKLLSFFERGIFEEAFLAKGRHKTFLENIPIWLVNHPYSVLQGAALWAKHQLIKAQGRGNEFFS